MKSTERLGEYGGPMSPPAWGAWIEIENRYKVDPDYASPPAWGAWIEIKLLGNACPCPVVAPRMGGVD